MIRTTVMLPRDLHDQVHALARRRGVPVAVVLREAIQGAVDAAGKPRLEFIGSIDAPGVSAEESVTLDWLFPPDEEARAAV
jgi:hypothetical protein